MSIPIKPPIKKPVIKKPNAKGIVKSLFNKYSSLILYIFVVCFLFSLIIYLFGGDNYSLSTFMWVQLILLLLGLAHIYAGPVVFSSYERYDSWGVIGFTMILSGFGVGLVFLSRNWDWLPTLPLPYANAWSLFLVPLLFAITIQYLEEVPNKVFKPWIYPYGKEIPIVEVINPIKVKFYVAKQRADDEYTEFALNVPKKYGLGDFMHYFIHRYNYDKNPESPIFISPDNSDREMYYWLFRRKPGSLKDKDVLDPVLSFDELGIKENDVIVVERYHYESNRGQPSVTDFNELEDNSELFVERDATTNLDSSNLQN